MSYRALANHAPFEPPRGDTDTMLASIPRIALHSKKTI